MMIIYEQNIEKFTIISLFLRHSNKKKASYCAQFSEVWLHLHAYVRWHFKCTRHKMTCLCDVFRGSCIFFVLESPFVRRVRRKQFVQRDKMCFTYVHKMCTVYRRVEFIENAFGSMLEITFFQVHLYIL